MSDADSDLAKAITNLYVAASPGVVALLIPSICATGDALVAEHGNTTPAELVFGAIVPFLGRFDPIGGASAFAALCRVIGQRWVHARIHK